MDRLALSFPLKFSQIITVTAFDRCLKVLKIYILTWIDFCLQSQWIDVLDNTEHPGLIPAAVRLDDKLTTLKFLQILTVTTFDNCPKIPKFVLFFTCVISFVPMPFLDNRGAHFGILATCGGEYLRLPK